MRKKLGFFFWFCQSVVKQTLLFQLRAVFPCPLYMEYLSALETTTSSTLGSRKHLRCCKESSQQLCTPRQVHFSPSSIIPVEFLICCLDYPFLQALGHPVIQERGRAESHLENSVLILPWALPWFLYFTFTAERFPE